MKKRQEERASKAGLDPLNANEDIIKTSKRMIHQLISKLIAENPSHHILDNIIMAASMGETISIRKARRAQ